MHSMQSFCCVYMLMIYVGMGDIFCDVGKSYIEYMMIEKMKKFKFSKKKSNYVAIKKDSESVKDIKAGVMEGMIEEKLI